MDPRTIQTAFHIRSGYLTRETSRTSTRIPLAPIQRIAERAPSRSATRKAIDTEPSAKTPNPNHIPFLLAHNSTTQRTVLLTPDTHALPFPRMEQEAGQFQRKAGNLHINTNHRYNSQPLAAALTDDPCLSGPNWSTFRMPDQNMEKATVVWLNTTLGLISQWAMANRTQHGMGYLTPFHARKVPTLDVTRLTNHQLHQLTALFNTMASTPMLPASCAWNDPARIQMETQVYQEVLGLTDPYSLALIQWLRNSWCLEPSVQASKGFRTVHSRSMDQLRWQVAESERQLELEHPGHTTMAWPVQTESPDAGISPQFLRDLAQAMDNADSTARYTNLHISAEGPNIAITMSKASAI